MILTFLMSQLSNQFLMSKSVIFLLFACLVFPAGAVSQRKVEWGLNLGSSYTTLRGNDGENNINLNIGYLAGLQIDYEFTPGLLISMELNYERRSLDTTVIFLDEFGREVGEGQNKDTYGYLNIPIMFKIPFGGRDLWSVEIGPFANILVNDNVESEVFGNSFKNTDFGITSGIGKSFVVNDKNQLALELRWELGLANISNLTSDIPGLEELRSATIKLMLTWIFTKN